MRAAEVKTSQKFDDSNITQLWQYIIVIFCFILQT